MRRGVLITLFVALAYGLRFSNSGQHDVGVDNLTLNPVDSPVPIPAPEAGLLALAGTALVGCLRRRRML